jgi:hypothetical protein
MNDTLLGAQRQNEIPRQALSLGFDGSLVQVSVAGHVPAPITPSLKPNEVSHVVARYARV